MINFAATYYTRCKIKKLAKPRPKREKCILPGGANLSGRAWRVLSEIKSRKRFPSKSYRLAWGWE